MQNKQEKFIALISNPEELRLSLNEDPELIHKQDEKGMTLLHYAACINSLSTINIISSVYLADQLFAFTGNVETLFEILFHSDLKVNFNILNHQGSTCLHIAAFSYVFSNQPKLFLKFLNEATKREFDFSTVAQTPIYLKPNLKLTILQILTYQHTTSLEALNSVLNVPNLGINTLSNQGVTALFYLFTHPPFYPFSSFLLMTQKIEALLDAGADPMLGSKNKKPFVKIDKLLTQCATKKEILEKKLSESSDKEKTDLENLESNEIYQELEEYSNMILALNKIKQKMSAHDSVIRYVDIRRSARVVEQGARDHFSLFSILSKELRIKIASHAHRGSQASPLQEEAEKIASEHLNKNFESEEKIPTLYHLFQS